MKTSDKIRMLRFIREKGCWHYMDVVRTLYPKNEKKGREILNELLYIGLVETWKGKAPPNCGVMLTEAGRGVMDLRDARERERSATKRPDESPEVIAVHGIPAEQVKMALKVLCAGLGLRMLARVTLALLTR